MKISALIFILFFLGCSGYSSLRQEEPGMSDQSDLAQLLAQMSDEQVNQDTGDVPLTDSESHEDVPAWSQELSDNVKGTNSKWLDSPQGVRSKNSVTEVSTAGGKAGAPRSNINVTPGAPHSESTGSPHRSGKAGAPRSLENTDSSPHSGKSKAPHSSKKQLHEESSIDLLPLGDDLEEISSIDGVITDNPYIDILFILDVSASMRKFLIQKSSDGFLFNINSLDWRIGFLSADSGNYGLLGLSLDNEAIQNLTFITPKVRENEKVFAETLVRSRNSITCVQRRQCGSKQEKPLGALNAYLRSSSSDEFLRENADLAVIIVTNNDENRDSNWDMITSQSVLETFRAKYGADKTIRGYSMTVMEESCRQKTRTLINRESNYAPVIRGFSERTEGGSFDICSASYADVGFAIAKDQLSSVN